ncbi:TetR/AcrR family transcriptional regulator [Thermocrispum sp.]|uniref:TetR/AcrR family transcriptional regulator n=1 Tax=Thermocrispum sp. TaxID=2060768 RepID=UPI00257AEC29|nr:TetR/AcrR family transcriptional regulator [Thermocrispum sp.]
MTADPDDHRNPYVARERILRTAYDLFSRRGIRAVGVDEVIERSSVAKATLYRHFRTKNELVIAFLERRQQVWTRELVLDESGRRGQTPEERLLAMFDVLDEWIHSDDFDRCTFINVLLEMGPDHPVGKAAIGYLEELRDMVKQRADEAGLYRTEEFARSWHILMKGSIIAAYEGDGDAARRAKRMAADLIEQHRSPDEPTRVPAGTSAPGR